VIANGVESMDRHQFPRPPELHADRFNLLIVGRLDLVKGHHLAIEALAMHYVPPDAHLHILGEGPRRQELKALAAARGIPDRVHLLGFRRNVYDYIANCDGLLMPSLHEGLPYTLLEGMALGVPVIASRVGGLAEVVQDGTTGILIQRDGVADLATAVLRLHQDPALGARLGDAGRRLQRARYSLNSMTAAYHEVYRHARLAVR
jgi:glycosyltransferase involved in cell wall biosynthesis